MNCLFIVALDLTQEQATTIGMCVCNIRLCYDYANVYNVFFQFSLHHGQDKRQSQELDNARRSHTHTILVLSGHFLNIALLLYDFHNGIFLLTQNGEIVWYLGS